jgi:hypothetical protein
MALRAAPGLDGVGLLVAEESGAVVLVALRIAARDGEAGPTGKSGRQAMEEVEQVVGILPGGVEADAEMGRPGRVAQDASETEPQLLITLGRLGERELRAGWLQIVAQQTGMMAVARRVDADAEAAHRLQGGR